MVDFFIGLFEMDFMPHGHCYFWEPFILWSHTISDSIIALAYMTIPTALIYIFRKRRQDFKYGWMAVIFAIFIFGCGLTHVFDVINIWKPYYRIDSVVRMITAAASIGAAVVLVRVTPQITKIPSAAQWIKVNEELMRQLQALKEKDVVIEAIRKFEELAEAAPQIMWVNDRNGILTYINKKWYDYTGSEQLVIKMDAMDYWAEYIHPDDYIAANEQWRRALKDGSKYDAELRVKGNDDEYCWFLVRSLPVKNEMGVNDRWFGTLTNINEQKRQNEILKKTNADLDNFVYVASHDLRAPIANMMGILWAMKEYQNGEENTKITRYIDMLSLSVEKLNVVIDDLTEVSRLGKTAQEITENLNVAETLDELEMELQEQIEMSSATIVRELKTAEIYFSKKNLRSILYNLISNAIKYRSPYRDPVVTVRFYEERNDFILEVEDNGIGFDPKKKDIIFDLFVRLQSSNQGTGVGLFIVKRIIDNIGGKIEVNSQPGVGSNFKIFVHKRNAKKV